MKAIHDAADTAPISTRANSPVHSAATTRHAPPASICMPVASSESSGSRAPREYNEPAAHESDALTSTIAPNSDTGPCEGTPISSATPAKPASNPATTDQDILRP